MHSYDKWQFINNSSLVFTTVPLHPALQIVVYVATQVNIGNSQRMVNENVARTAWGSLLSPLASVLLNVDQWIDEIPRNVCLHEPYKCY